MILTLAKSLCIVEIIRANVEVFVVFSIKLMIGVDDHPGCLRRRQN